MQVDIKRPGTGSIKPPSQSSGINPGKAAGRLKSMASNVLRSSKQVESHVAQETQKNVQAGKNPKTIKGGIDLKA
ncbi:MAG: hypothetical protein OEY64_01065 [Nitrospinota bacterium]|nr:hypothetical protein [Nitrospinota bacterium]